MSSVTETSYLSNLSMVGIILLFSATDDISSSLFVRMILPDLSPTRILYPNVAPKCCNCSLIIRARASLGVCSTKRTALVFSLLSSAHLLLLILLPSPLTLLVSSSPFLFLSRYHVLFPRSLHFILPLLFSSAVLWILPPFSLLLFT